MREIDPDEITNVVAPALGRTTAELGDWTVDLLARPAVAGLATVGIWRVRGADWSAVLKLLRHAGDTGGWASAAAADHPYYWRREAEALRAPVIAGLSGGVRAPRCYGVVDRPDGSTAVWIEDVGADTAATWSMPRFGTLARQMGRAQGRLVGYDGLTEPWLSRRWLRAHVERRQDFAGRIADHAVWRHPAVSEVLPVNRAADFRRLWEEHLTRLEQVEALPQTLCHLDFHPLNVFGREGESVVIDWAFVGVGAVGEDPATLVLDAVADFHLPPERLGAFFDTIVDGYTAGLAESGSPYGREEVARMIALGALVRFAWLPPALLAVVTEDRPTLNRRPAAEAVPYWAAVARFLLDLDARVRGAT